MADRLPAADQQQQRRRVLIVDDYPGVADVMGAELQGHGYEVATSRDFHDARRQLSSSRMDVLVTDVRLGAFNGLQLAVIARSTWPAIRIVIISGFDDPVLKAEAAGVNAAYLVKPVITEHLITTLQAMGDLGEANGLPN
jgi:DNA-binding NtrC family response regulator